MPNRRQFLATTAGALAACATPPSEIAKRPNILVCYSDDISWLHKGAYGAKGLNTPAFDRVAAEGALFNYSYTGCPSCAPSRACTLSGRQIYLTGQGGMLMGAYPGDLDAYPLMLRDVGYHVGYTGKGYSPGATDVLGRTEYPIGTRYNDITYAESEVRDGINRINYAANFDKFLEDRPADAPFCFWFGATEAHRRYAYGAGRDAGKSLEDVDVPAFFPDTEEVRSDILDYYVEIEWFDQHVERCLSALERIGELDNTIVVVTSDNGMPFPRAKTTLYDWGVRMPLAIRWGDRVPGGRVIDDFVHHQDFAPTFLEAAGLAPTPGMTGKSLMPLLESSEQGQIDPSRDFAVTAFERHTWCRPEGTLYPSRMIRTADYLYIRNYNPDRWPAGDPDFDARPQGFYGDIDRCPTKTFMMENREKYPKEFELSFGRRPGEELFRPADDPYQVNNLADDPARAKAKQAIAKRLDDYLSATGDPRASGAEPWADYPYYSGDRDPRKQPA